MIAGYCQAPDCTRAVYHAHQRYCGHTCQQRAWLQRTHRTKGSRPPMASHPKGPSDYGRTESGNFRYECPDCEQVLIAETADELDGLSCACKRRVLRTEWRIDLACSLCGSLHRSIAVPGATSRLIFTRTIHCQRCGGSVWAPDPPELVRIYDEPTFRPSKRGRPARKEQAAA